MVLRSQLFLTATCIFLLPVVLSSQLKDENKSLTYLRVCYYAFGEPSPEVINGTLCTHIINGFAVVVDGKLSVGAPEHLQQCIDTVKLKETYPHLKVMLSVGGGGGSDSAFSNAVNSKSNRTRLLNSAVNFLRKYGFDGLDIDWEFPVWNSYRIADKKNFILFLQEFKAFFKRRSENPLLLSAAVAAPKFIINDAYDVPGMARSVDFINLMSYDYHDYRWYLPVTESNSPLFNRSVELFYFATLNTAWSAAYWTQKGMPMRKILVGLPTYGHTYTLLNPKKHYLDAPATGIGIGGGDIAYYDVCKFLAEGGTRVFDNESKVPYAYHNYDWISYDDYESIAIKAKWVKDMGYGGVMTFDLNSDDWKKMCGVKDFPLHQIIYDVLTSS